MKKANPEKASIVQRKKTVCAVEHTDDGKVKRIYTFQIPYYIAKFSRKIFKKYIHKQAKITINKWKDYNPISKDYDQTGILIDKGSNFKAFQIVIYQVKSW